MKYPRRKLIRLDKHLYQGLLIASVTLCFYNDYNVIKNGLSDLILKILNNVTIKYNTNSYAYCLMTNHLHWLIGISNNEHNLLDIIKYLKSKTFFQLKSKYNTPQLWQDRFYDYIPRKDEDVYKHARYILENPVRKKMVTNFADYPYSGGIYFDDLINA